MRQFAASGSGLPESPDVLKESLMYVQYGHRRLYGSKAKKVDKLQEYQQALFDNGYMRGCMLRARMLHLFLCRRVGACICTVYCAINLFTGAFIFSLLFV